MNVTEKFEVKIYGSEAIPVSTEKKYTGITVKKDAKKKFFKFHFLSTFKIWAMIISQVTGKYIKPEIDKKCNRNHNALIKYDEPLENQDMTQQLQVRHRTLRSRPLKSKLDYYNMNGK